MQRREVIVGADGIAVESFGKRVFVAPDITAAVALSSSPNSHVRKRLQVAVETCADDDPRAALEAAALGQLQEPALQRLRRR